MLVTGALQDFRISHTTCPALRPYLLAVTIFTPGCPLVLRAPKAPRYTYGKTNPEATPHMNFWFCSQPHPPPLPPPMLRKPDVQMVNGEKKSHPDHLKRG